MILSSGRSYVFVHIPKTGGTSLAAALEARAMRDDILIGDTPKARRRRQRLAALKPRGRLWKHSTLSDIDGVLDPDELERMFVFTLVRNPWDRMVSYYNWLRTQSFAHPDVAFAQDLNFDAFLAEAEVAERFRRAPASSYVMDATGVIRCNLFIRLEHFAEDAVPLFDHLGFDFQLPRLNASARDRDYRAYFNPTTRQRVAEICAEDIARFKYAF
ncbi:MAG: sulfotransferase family 2 domain-containing protein [Pseudomonadota bacterium]